MSLTVVGSIAFDSITTPFGAAERELGGSATHAALAGALATDVRIVGAVGDDFSDDHDEVLRRHAVITSDIERIPNASTFFWRGHYGYDLSVAQSDETQLNVFDGWSPRLSQAAVEADVLFLAAMDPETQASVRAQWQGAKWSALDTVGYWIEAKRDRLIEAIGQVDIVLMTDQEARELTRRPMLLQAARQIVEWGASTVVLKLGEYGCALLGPHGYFSLPGYALEEAADPTGTGDAFAGAFLGYLDLLRGPTLTEEALRRAMIHGSVIASFWAEDFGSRRRAALTEHVIAHRVEDFKRMTHFEHVPTGQRAGARGQDGVVRLPRPRATPSTRGYDAPGPTAGTRSYGSAPQGASSGRVPAPRSAPGNVSRHPATAITPSRRSAAAPHGGTRHSPPATRPTYAILSPSGALQISPAVRRALADAAIDIVTERRLRDRRRDEDRRGPDGAEPHEDRRRIRNASGRRIADRRAELVEIEPPLLRAALVLPGDVRFVERLEPEPGVVGDFESDRLVTRVQAGDRDAFATLYQRHFDEVHNYLRIVLEDEYEAEDGVQQVFVQALQALPRYERRSTPFRAWLFTIVRNHAITQLRRRRRVDVLEPDSVSRHLDELEWPERDLSALGWIEDSELLALIRRLPVSQRQVLLLRYMLDLSNAQCASILGRSPNEAAVLHYRALRFLEERLIALGKQPRGSRRP
jgi:RNA polymerase sigma factor (sigma-70 family)